MKPETIRIQLSKEEPYTDLLVDRNLIVGEMTAVRIFPRAADDPVAMYGVYTEDDGNWFISTMHCKDAHWVYDNMRVLTKAMERLESFKKNDAGYRIYERDIVDQKPAF